MYKQFYNLSVFDDLHGLSCVENLLLYIMKLSQYSYQHLFYNSFMNFDDVLDAFMNENEVYANFTKVPRIQDTAVDIGVVEMNLCDSLNLDDETDRYMLISVKPEYIKDKYNVELWRNDHYIMIQRNGNQYRYINDNPRDIGDISIEKLYSIFDGKMIRFKIKGDIRPDCREQLRRRFICNLKSLDYGINLQKFAMTDWKLLRDALGIYRILTRRLYDFSSLYMSAEFILPQIKYLDKQYMLVEYMRKKNKIDSIAIDNIIEKVREYEKINIPKIMLNMEEHR